MTVEFMDRRNLDFVLYEMLEVEKLTTFDLYRDHSRDTFDAILDVAQQMATEKFFPLLTELDANEPVLENGKVKLPAKMKEALAAYAEAGFLCAHHGAESGGIQLPHTVDLASHLWFAAANIAMTTYLSLTKAAANVIAHHGTKEQKALYLPAMLDGRCFGTMVLTEPQAGSSLADITTTARPDDQGRYLIKGNKIFISAGEHELSENIVHLVLARIEGAPPGIKGISLFLVPRFHVNADGSPGAPNDVALAGLIHKMGWRGTTSTMLNFGENDSCVGYLIGEPNRGLECMFLMMNEARVDVGLSSVMLGYASYLYSLDYARNRPQGRHPGNSDPMSKPVMLVEHADVRRMLLMQKSFVEGSFALCLYAGSLLDHQKASPDETVRRESGLLLDILTPVIKAWSTELNLEANYQSIQVLGGYGYTREYPVEQYYRTNRLNAIHEGANGIQAIDLLGRKASLQNGAALRVLSREMRKSAEAAAAIPSLAAWGDDLRRAVETVEATTALLHSKREEVGQALFLANASGYLEMVGHAVIAWMWLRQAQAATAKLAAAGASDQEFYRGKLQACRYYFRWELPKIYHRSALLKDLDSTCYDMQDGWF